MTATAAAFWDRIAERYAKSPIKDIPTYEKTLDRTRAHLTPTDTALEIGCGTGSTALRLAGDVGHLTATDIAPGMIAIAKRKQAEGGPENLSFGTAAVSDIAAETPFDAVMAFNLLHLTPDLDGTLAQIAQLVRPGGVLISKSACLSHGAWLFRPLVGAMQLVGKAPKVTFFTTQGLEQAMEAHGFEILEAETFAKRPPSHFIVARRSVG